MQNFAGRILTNTKKFDHITLVLHELGWLTIEELLRLRDVTMIFKCPNGLAPSYLHVSTPDVVNRYKSISEINRYQSI